MTRQLIIPAGDQTKALVEAIAMDIGKEVAHHVETMYPDAVKATSPNMLKSIRGCVFNEVMAAIKVTDEGEIVTRLHRRRAFRKKIKAMAKAVRL
jgi:hypothetical protein